MELKQIARCLLLAGCFPVAGLALAADKAKPMPADHAAAMEKMKQAGTPGAAQQKLDPLAGRFNVKSKMWMDPSQPPTETTGTSERKWIYGNRYLTENFEGTYGGQPFSGMGTMGYDNVTQKYFGTWIDSMSTGLTTSHGSFDGKVLKYKGMMSDPMTGKETPYTMSIAIADNDHHTTEMWGPGPNGKNMKWMEMSYTRVK